jgi:asparagine synthase (glutamine-hydrolysing)
MCGISGIYSKKDDLNKTLFEFNNSLKHRGPDKSSVYLDDKNNFGMAHTRLSILDISEKGSQPMIHKNNWIITYNGELYNHHEIRNFLANNHNEKINWEGSSDTETILKSIDILGIKKSLNLFEGMFAFGLYDKSEKKLYLARDRMGEKPLYFYSKEQKFIFASEISIFKKVKELNLKINEDSVLNFIQTGYVSSPNSIFKDIHKLKPGTLLTVSNNFKNLKQENFWSLKNIVTAKDQNIPNNKSYKQIKNETKNLLEDKIKKTMLSDVQVGSFLSGGIDSSLVAAIMQKHSSNPIKTFTVGFDDKNFDESSQAKLISNHLRTDHYEYRTSKKDILDMAENIHHIYEEPFADSSQIPTYLISKLMKSQAKVILSGDGGDELFSGYNRYVYYKIIKKIFKTIPNFCKQGIGNIAQNSSFEFFNKFFSNKTGDKIQKVLNFATSKDDMDLYKKFISIWEDPSNILNINFKSINFDKWDIPSFNSFEEKMMYLDQLSYLPDDIMCKVDRATMSNSIESRSPFLNHEIVEASWKIPMKYKIKNKKGKFILRDILQDYYPRNLIQSQKSGFAIPIGELLRTTLRNWGNDIISQSKENDYFINLNELKILWKKHQDKKINFGEKLWVVLNLQNWLIKQKYY